MTPAYLRSVWTTLLRLLTLRMCRNLAGSFIVSAQMALVSQSTTDSCDATTTAMIGYVGLR
jgi:formate/nitrite transporter FocA (FNT family)